MVLLMLADGWIYYPIAVAYLSHLLSGERLPSPDIGQRRLTHVPIGLCTKIGELHPELRIFLNFSWVIVIYHFVGCSNVYLKIIVKYEIDHHILSFFLSLNCSFNVTINDISVIFVTAHRCAGGLKKKYDLRSGSQRHRHFVGFFNVPVLAPTRDQPFYTVIPTHRPT